MGENRILCIPINGNCRYFREVTGPEPWLLETVAQGCYCLANGGWDSIKKDKCKSCPNATFYGITREQAIEAMVNGMIEKDENSPDGAGFIDLAEAALNALLEIEK